MSKPSASTWTFNEATHRVIEFAQGCLSRVISGDLCDVDAKSNVLEGAVSVLQTFLELVGKRSKEPGGHFVHHYLAASLLRAPATVRNGTDQRGPDEDDGSGQKPGAFARQAAGAQRSRGGEWYQFVACDSN